MVDELVVVCWKWKGWRGEMYKAHHVNVLEHMVKQHLHIPYRFVCVTDDPKDIHCQTIPIWNDPEVMVQGKRPNCYRRLKVFSREATKIFRSRRVLSIDLDCVIFDDITPLVTDDDFKIMMGKASPLNGSMFLHTLGTKVNIWNSFGCNAQDLMRRRERANNVRLFGSDQAWMSYCEPKTPVWTPADGAYHYTLLKGDIPADARICFFAGSHKPWNPIVADKCPRAYDTYAEHSEKVFGVKA
jgi:hypothetical protein